MVEIRCSALHFSPDFYLLCSSGKITGGVLYEKENLSGL